MPAPTTKSLDDFKPDTRFLGLFVAKSKDGKSTAAASFPEPYHEIDTDLRFGGIANSAKQGIIKNKKISYTQFTPNSGWEPLGSYIEQLNIYRMQAAQNVIAFPYKTMGLGSLGSLERIVMNMARKELDGRTIVGGLRLGTPNDQRVTNSAVHQVIDALQSMPCNVVCTAHLIDKWGKPKYASEKETKEKAYLPNEIIGERLNLNDNLAESIISRFDNVFRFDRQDMGDKIKYTVEFSGDLAGNSYGIPPGKFDWTGKDFFTWFMSLVEKVQSGLTSYDKLVEAMKK